ncbi:MAG: sigma-54-dependent Fis family transcriptional regulator, partial [candidate division Zixibacteria bacterium]|nr:sigma-54-dependent Fis family transcriptional regulator [candidate division Zixibacteria bacterium]
WPGNVRQLENLIKQVVVRGDENIVGELISGGQVPFVGEFHQNGETTNEADRAEYKESNAYSLKRRVGSAIAMEEKKLISEVLNKTNWNRRKAADLLEISYRSLLYKIKEYNLNSVK